MKVMMLVVMVGLLGSYANLTLLTDTEQSSAPPSKSKLGVYTHAAVAADNLRCSQIGTDILEQGGSAVDSVIAALLCDGVQNMHSMGLGGGFFMTYYNRETKTSTIIDARESAPALATEDMYVNKTNRQSVYGGKAIGVPGEVRGYAEAHRRWGLLPWRDLFTPTISMCREGFRISAALSKAIYSSSKGDCAKLGWNMNDIFFMEVDGSLRLRQEGDLLQLPELADTLEVLANEGAEQFYTGDLARKIISDIQSVGGILTEQDLIDYEVKVKEPLKVHLDDYIIYSPPPPASGSVLQLILNILDGYNFTADDISTTEKRALTYHRIIEAFKFAYAKRSELGDEDYVNVTEIVTNMTSEDYANSLRLHITDDHTHNISYYGPSFALTQEEHGTAHISVLAENGDAAAVTSTINRYFGSCVRSTQTGVIFNDEMDDFSTPGTSNSFGIPASPSNFIVPGKRPMSSMTPSVLTDPEGDALIVIGASGGSKITTVVAYTLIHDFWLGLKINQAIDEYRLHHQLAPNILQYEAAFNKSYHDTLEILHKKKGHAIGLMGDFSTAVQGISVDYDNFPNRTIYAYSDQRKGGLPDGY